MALESRVAERWLFGVLSGDATLATLVGARIYSWQAEQNVVTPYIVYQQQGGEGDLMVVGSARVWSDYLYLVRGVTKGASFQPLDGIAERIDTLLHDRAGAVTGGSVFHCYRERTFQMVEQDGITRHMGSTYRIKAKSP